MSDPLVMLRSAIAAQILPRMVIGTESSEEPTDDIVKATSLVFPAIPGISGTEIVTALDMPTRFQLKDPERYIDVRTVYNCWLTRDLGVTDYITISDERGILNLKFLDRTDLLTWLEGASTESNNIVDEKSSSVAKTVVGSVPSGKPRKREIDPELQQIYSQERSLIDHNRALRGNKRIDFSSVSAECRQRIIVPFRGTSAKPQQPHNNYVRPTATDSTTTPKAAQLPTGKNKDPIILLSPSASALINMGNVKDFLESGLFSPTMASSGAANLLRISRISSKLGPVRFVVVDSVERFKPEYWDRVVAVFVTGQSWQFKPYQWSDPNVLFQRVLGFALVYRGDPTPPTLTQWNVKVETLDRNQRFRDKEVVERVWDRIEQSMIARGWPTKRR
jgi:parafibromin